MTDFKTEARTMLQQRIHSSIPLSQDMNFSIAELDTDMIIVRAPLSPNVNIHGTGFAGSLYSLAILTGWAICTHIMDVNQLSGELVVGKAEIRYRSPVTDDIECFCMVSRAEREAFIDAFKASGKGRLKLKVEIGVPARAELEATLVAIANAG